MKQHPGTFIAGVIFTIIGIVYLLEAFDVWQVDLARTWPVALIACGVVIILNSRQEHHEPAILPPATEEPQP